MVRSKLGLIGYIFSFGLLFVLFQNCAQDVTFHEWDELARAGIEGDLRTHSFNPTEPENKPKINVDTIVDNSYSMSPIQQQVKSAFSNVAYKLKGLSGEVSLYTTTQDEKSQYKDKISYQTKSRIQFIDENGNPVDIDGTNTSGIPEDKSYLTIVDYLLSNPFLAENKPLIYSYDMSSADFDNFAASYSSAIGNLGTDGSDHEQGICTLLRTIEKNKDKSGFQTYIIAANEDDSTKALDCLKGKTQEVKKVPKPGQEDKACVPGDEGCNHTYHLTYNPTSQSELRFRERIVSERIYFSSSTPKVTLTGERNFNKHYTKMNYSFHNKKEHLEYRKTLVRDGLELPDQNLSILDFNQVVGKCTDNRKACSPEQIAQLGGQKIEPGSCYYVCKDSVSAKQPKDLSNWTYGLCKNTNVNDCDINEKNIARGNIDINHIASCTTQCHEETANTGKFTVNTKTPNTCNFVERDCEGSEPNDAIGSLPNLPGNKAFTSCRVKCTQQNERSGNAVVNNSLNTCGNLGETETGEFTRNYCSDAELKIAAKKLEVPEEQVTCEYYKCNQTQRTTGVVRRLYEACTPGAIDASDNDKKYVDDRWGSSRKIVGYPKSCRMVSTKATCQMTLEDDGNSCDFPEPANSLEVACAAKQSRHTISKGSCKITQSTKKGEVINYTAVPGAVRDISLTTGGDVVEQASRGIIDNHGDRFYLAAFVHPTDDKDCIPAGAGLSEGKRYERLVEQLGETNSRVFPICLDDYSKAFEYVFDIVIREVNRSYELKFDTETEWIWKIRLVYSDGREVVVDKENYKINNTIVTFKNEEMLKGVIDVKVDIVTPETPRL